MGFAARSRPLPRSAARLLPVLVLLAACTTTRVYEPEVVGDARVEAFGGPETVSVLSLNLRYDTPYDRQHRWQDRREALLRLLAQAGADLVALQEVATATGRSSFGAPRQLEDLTGALGDYTPVVESPDGRIPESLPLFLRRETLELEGSGWFTFSERPWDPGSTAWGARLPRHCLWARVRLRGSTRRAYVFNVHLSHSSRKARERSAALLLEKIRELNREGLPVLVLGDLNACPGSRAVAVLKRGGLRDVHRGFPGGTAHAYTGLPFGPRVDYILVSQGVSVHAASILRGLHLGRLPSDHFPVSAVLSW